MDIYRFKNGLEELKKEALANISTRDYRHLRKIEWWGRGLSLFGYLTAWIIPNPLTAFALSMGKFTRWLLAHHILHRGYDRVPNISSRYTSKGFALKWRRYIDWFDWLEPAAWDYEHNILHHYHTGEDHDPDLAERYLEFLRQAKIPKFSKYIFIFIAACTWKFTYYAPNTASVMTGNKRKPKDNIIYLTIKNIFNFSNKQVLRLWSNSYLPYMLFYFVLIPLLYFPLGKTAILYVFINTILAEVFTNLHSFIVIGPNHTANDIYRFDFHYDNKEEHLAMQVLGSVNYTCGSEIVDYLSIWLNYQIEHHLMPDLPMLKYREFQPKVKALCLECGIPYRQESIWIRLKKMVDVCVGNTSMKSLKHKEELLEM